MKKTKFALATIAILFLLISALPISSADQISKKLLPDIEIDEDETAIGEINLCDYFTSEDPQIYFSFVSTANKVEVTINDDGSVDFSALKDWYGSEKITFIASDGEYQASDTIIVTVKPVNDAPKLIKPLSYLDEFEFEEDCVLIKALNLHDHFQDIDSTCVFSFSSSSIIADIDDYGIVDFSAPKDWHGQEEVVFTASDGELQVTDSVLVTVLPVNDGPKAKMNSVSISLNRDENSRTLVLADYFADVDDEVLEYELSGSEKIKYETFSDRNELKLYAPEGWKGEELLTITARDSSGETSSIQMVVIVSQGSDSSGQIFYLFGLVLAVGIAGARLQIAGRRKPAKSPVNLSSYRHYKGL